MNTSLQERSNNAVELNGSQNCGTVNTGRHSNSVWLVDDDEKLRPLLAELLGRMKGVERPREFSTPRPVLEALRREAAPDTILLDIHLGDQNGLEFIQPIKLLAPATRVLVLTTFFDPEHYSRALKAGAAGFLLKSAPLQEIVRSVLVPPAQAETTQGTSASLKAWQPRPHALAV